MKRKVIRLLFALVLVLSLSLIPAVPAGAASSSYPGLQFQVQDISGTAVGTASWVEDTHTGAYAVDLETGDPDVSEPVDFACVVLPYNQALSTITDLGYSYKLVDGNMGDYWDSGPYIVLELDNDDDNTADTWVVHHMFAMSVSPHDWLHWGLGDSIPAEHMATGNGTAMWHIAGDNSTDNINWVDIVSAHGAYTVLNIKVAVGEWTSDINTGHYIDDVTINDVTYDLEPRVINTDTSEGFNNIQDAIDDVDTVGGHTITVAAGTYNESLTIDKGLTLQGESSDNTTINGAHTANVSDVSLSGFEFTSAGSYLAIKIDSSGAALSNFSVTACVFTMSTSPSIGVSIGYAAGASPNKVSNVTISNNTFNGPTDMIANPWKIGGQFGSPVGCEVENVDFEGNTVNKCSTPINLQDQNITDILINNNTFRNTDGVVYVWGEGTPTGVLSSFVFTNNDVDSTNSYGVGIDLSGATVFDDANFGTGNRVNYNNFVGIPGAYGFDAVSILSTLTTYTLDAENNWWGNASGPLYASALYDIAYGDNVSANVDYEPWLLAVVVTGVTPTTYEKTLALKDGWTLVSVDKEVTTGTAWTATLAYKYTAGSGYTQVTLATQLTSVDAYYLKTSGGGGVGINYSTSAPGVVIKTLGTGWNIISCAGELDAYTLLSQLRYVQVGEQQGTGLTSLIGQGNYNQFTASISETLVTSTEWDDFDGVVTLNAFDGYWVQMNAGKSFGVIPD